MSKTWINIFNNGEMVEYDPDNYYIIWWSVNNNCVVLKNGVSIVDNPLLIFKQYNIFDGKIGVDIESFCEEYERSYERIREIIIDQYGKIL